jgi:hypothetical protein
VPGLARTERVQVTTMTDARTSRAHLVTDDAAAAGRRIGHYRAVCGELVLAASLTTPERGSCRACMQWRAGR